MLRLTGRFFGALLALAACATSAPQETSGAAAAIEAVLAEDTALGGIRNHAPEKMPLAEAVAAYVQGLDAIHFSKCPADFTSAFKRHRDAWQESIGFLEQHAELRGEMHDLFDQIGESSHEARVRIESLEKRIWDTWAEVEGVVERHGSGSN